MKRIFLIGMTMAVFLPATSRELYRAPFIGDAGSYYVLSKTKSRGGFTVLTSRVGKGGEYTNFSEVQVDCQIRQYRELKGSEESGAIQKPTKPLKVYTHAKWTDLVPGSSKSDLVAYLCK